MAEGRYVLIAQMDVDMQVEGEFNDWLLREHLPAVQKVPGVLSAKRYMSPTGEPKYMVIYELASPDVPTTEAWDNTRKVGRTAKLRPYIRNGAYRMFRQY